MMKFADLQSKSRRELEELLRERQIALGKLNFERTAKSLKKSNDLSKTKKTIARIKTLLNGGTK